MKAAKAKLIILDTLNQTAGDCSVADYRERLGDLIDEMTDRFNAASDSDDVEDES